MPVVRAGRTLARMTFLFLCCLGVLVSCAKDPVRVDRNRPPQTFLVAAPAESAAASYRIHLYWRGEDSDGYISGFLWSWDDSTVGAFRFTTKTDSVFQLAVNDSASLLVGSGTNQPDLVQTHTFYIRAVDNLGKADPRLTIFNRRIFNAGTSAPVVKFVGDIVPVPVGLDTLCDNQPFKVCWTGSDEDGYVTYYRWDVGVFSSPLQTDTCATFNDETVPGSVPLISGVYTMTVTAVDNAFARSNPAAGGSMQFVVNHDPETRILGRDESPTSQPIGHYIQHFLNGAEVHIEGFFVDGDRVPYRSTVWWKWEGHDFADADCDERSGEGNEITGYSAVLHGYRNDNIPYVIGFRDSLCVSATTGETVRFTTNNPEVIAAGGACSFQELVLDSLDAGNGMLFTVAARDRSGRGDGTPAYFRFSCNYPPTIKSFTVETVTMADGKLAKRFRWEGSDLEDGLTKEADLTLDGQLTIPIKNYAQEATVLESEFKIFASENPHHAELTVRDRAGVNSEERRSVEFDVTYP